MAHPVLTKGFLQLSPEAAMLPRPSVETHPPPPCPSLSSGAEPKRFPEVTSQAESCMAHICVYRVYNV